MNQARTLIGHRKQEDRKQNDKYDAMRFGLEQYLTENKISLADVELAVFDKIVSLRRNYDSMIDTRNNAYLENDSLTSPDYSGKISDAMARIRSNNNYLKSTENVAVPAFVVLIGYDNSNDHTERLYDGDWYSKKIPVLMNSRGKKVLDDYVSAEFDDIASQDNAIIIDDAGLLCAKHVLISNVDPYDVLEYRVSKGIIPSLNMDDVRLMRTRNMTRTKDTHLLMGFAQEVSSRHESALSGSLNMKGVAIYTLSGETGNIRRMESGNISHSTIPEESTYKMILPELMREFYEQHTGQKELAGNL